MPRFLPVCCVILLNALSLSAQVADTISVVHFNVMRYAENGCLNLTTKNARLKTVFNYLQPDILTVNEMTSNAASVSSLRVNSLVYNPAMQETVYGNSTNSSIVNMLYFNAAKLGFLGHEAIIGNVRDIDIYRLYSLASTAPGDTVDFYCIVAHFKSSTGSSNEVARAESAQNIVDWLDGHPEVQRVIMTGDLNLYTHFELAYQTLLTRLEDIDWQLNGWAGPENAIHHTQSPAESDLPCSISGGMDDRFDFIFSSASVLNGNDLLRYEPGSYRVVANDGNSYNTVLGCATNTSVPYGVCNALRNVSDHLPVMARFITGPATATKTAPNASIGFRVLGNPVSHRQIRIQQLDQRHTYTSWRLSGADGRWFEMGSLLQWQGEYTEIEAPLAHAGVYFLSLLSEKGVWESVPIIIE